MSLKIEIWPKSPVGMCTGKIPPGIKVTDTKTNKSVVVNRHRQQHKNKDEAIDLMKRGGGKKT